MLLPPSCGFGFWFSRKQLCARACLRLGNTGFRRTLGRSHFTCYMSASSTDFQLCYHVPCTGWAWTCCFVVAIAMKDLLLLEAGLRLLLSYNAMGKNHRRNAISDGKTLQTLENCSFNQERTAFLTEMNCNYKQ